MAARIACDEEHDTRTIYFTNIDENSASEVDYINGNEKDLVTPIDLNCEGGEHDTSAIYFTNENVNNGAEGHYVNDNDEEDMAINKSNDEGYSDASSGIHNSSEASGIYDSLEYTSATPNDIITGQITPQNEFQDQINDSKGQTPNTNLFIFYCCYIGLYCCCCCVEDYC